MATKMKTLAIAIIGILMVGSAYGEWTQLGDDIDGEEKLDQSGSSISLSADGNILAIGASANDANGNSSGHVRIFEWAGTVWTQLGEDIDGEAEGSLSGGSVSLSTDGSIVAIGARDNDGAGDNSGHVRIWSWADDTPCTPCADVTAAAVEQLCQITAARPPNSVLELQDTVNSIVDTLLAGTDICETNCDIAGQLIAPEPH
jgi:hypothetical protein